MRAFWSLRYLWRVLIVFAAATVLWSMIFHPWGWAYGIGVHPYPASSGTPWTYQLWSGFMPALTVLTLAGSATSLWRLHNCHASGCWRLGKHKVSGTPWCTRHAAEVQAVRNALGPDPDPLAALIGRVDKVIELLEKR